MIAIEKALAAIPEGFQEKLVRMNEKERETGQRDLSEFSKEDLEYLSGAIEQMQGEVKELKKQGVIMGPPSAEFLAEAGRQPFYKRILQQLSKKRC